MSQFSFDRIGQKVAPLHYLIAAVLLVTTWAAAWLAGVEPRVALLLGFDVGVAGFLTQVFPLLGENTEQMRCTAEKNDANRLVVLTVCVLLSLVIFIAVANIITQAPSHHWFQTPLIVVTLIEAWTFANAVFTLHYAHLYYLQTDGKDRGGIEVPGTDVPDYWDFVYFSYNLGMTFQTSDIIVTAAHFRRVVLFHCLSAFIFNTGILAFTINSLG